jgi:ABC-type transport system substrate-binding protein
LRARALVNEYRTATRRDVGTRDPDVWSEAWHSPAPSRDGIPLNLARIDDPAIDAALDAARGTADVAERQRAYRTVQQRFADLVPYVWLYRMDWIIASQQRVHNVFSVTLPDGFPAEPFNAGVFRLTETWVET